MDEAPYLYQLFGFTAASNRPIPGLRLANDRKRKATLNIFLGCRPRPETTASKQPETLVFASTALSESGDPVLAIYSNDEWTHLVCDGHTEFWFDRTAENIWGLWSAPHAVDDAATYLLGPVLGLLLSQKGIVCLHASAVAIAGKAVLFSGDAGAGKSTTAAAMTRRGHAILADDIVAILEDRESFYATPAYPYLSLWPESVELLYGTNADLSPFSPTFPKYLLSVGNAFQESPLPLGTIFILGERASEFQSAGVEQLTAHESLLALVANSYAAKVLDIQARASEFRLLSRMMATVPVLRLHAHSEPKLITNLCEMIEGCCG